MLSRNQSTAIYFRLFAMIQTSTYLYWSMYFPRRCKQGIDQQIFNRKWISRKITHPQSWK